MKGAFLWWVIVPVTLLFLYAVSAWPVNYCLTKIFPLRTSSEPVPDFIKQSIGFIYSPHYWIAHRNEAYYGYLMSSYNVDDPAIRLLSWDEYQEYLKRLEEEKSKDP